VTSAIVGSDQGSTNQSLYRRYPRPSALPRSRQDHVVTPSAMPCGRSRGHAYLFSGPRGTGKTSPARILAKALNAKARSTVSRAVCATPAWISRGVPPSTSTSSTRRPTRR